MEERTYNETVMASLLGEFKTHLRITSADLDSVLMQILKASIASAEAEISTVIALSSFALSKTASSSALKLRWPVQEVSSVSVEGEEVSGDSYSYDEGSITFADDVTGKRIEVAYSAGLAQIPESIKAAAFLIGGSLFNNPTDRPEERDRTTARNLLRPFRTWGEHDNA